MKLHAGARFGLGNGYTTDLICCDECGTVAAEAIARHQGWGMWVDHKVRHHHCVAHTQAHSQLMFDTWQQVGNWTDDQPNPVKVIDYVKNWNEWD
jgi:transcription initiation factor TFIIIB Brf1 subunit/transcription initiation factor TFIIB